MSVFLDIDEAEIKVTSLDLVPIELPRICRPPRRITGDGSVHHSTTARDYYRSQYFEFVDTVIEHLTTRFNADNNDLRQYLALENMITSGKIDNSVINFYPEISAQRLEFQLPIFIGTRKAVSLKGARDAYCKMHETNQQMFSEVFLLMKILFVCPVSSCECERSFSALRRLKMWLRSTMSQCRLNHVAVCHTHKDEVDTINIEELMKEFINRSSQRRSTFGNM
ncbi:uncharacterized protein LOC143249539 [Tachypleus tridentatus]|uniref:uncharacterized protein LOC143249539 n=1 Tax=Tachypleus tridentatus TaxID=6853 RepID=UPI003FD1FC92